MNDKLGQRALWAAVVSSLVWLGACGGGRGAQPSDAAELSTASKARAAESFFNAGRISEALARMDEVLAEEPDNAALHHFHGQINFRAGRWNQAETSFNRALELDPLLTDAYNFLGAIYQEQGRADDAEQAYRRALADPAYPTPEKVYLNLGLLYKKQGRDQDALSELRRSVEINPKYYKAHFELASTLDRLGKLQEAAREYVVAAPGFRFSGDFHYRLGLAYFKLGQAHQAKESLRRAIDVSPGSESAARSGELLELIE